MLFLSVEDLNENEEWLYIFIKIFYILIRYNYNLKYESIKILKVWKESKNNEKKKGKKNEKNN